VYLLKRKSEGLPFTVMARNAEEAIERAIKEYDVPSRAWFPASAPERLLKFPDPLTPGRPGFRSRSIIYIAAPLYYVVDPNAAAAFLILVLWAWVLFSRPLQIS
jgi:hypothetical protein